MVEVEVFGGGAFGAGGNEKGVSANFIEKARKL